jgi:hypothetical protein
VAPADTRACLHQAPTVGETSQGALRQGTVHPRRLLAGRQVPRTRGDSAPVSNPLAAYAACVAKFTTIFQLRRMARGRRHPRARLMRSEELALKRA